MKKVIGTFLVVLSFLFMAAPAQAQVQFGVVGGLNITKMSFDNLPGNFDSNNRCGWYLGPKIELKVPLVGLGLDAALEFSHRRLNTSYEEDGATLATSKSYNTIEIPINLRYSVGLSSLASVYLATGPQFGFNVGSKNWSWANTSQYKLKNSNMSWNIGVGAKVLGHLEVGAGYNFALSKFAKNVVNTTTGVEVPGDSNFKGSGWQVQVAYLF